MRSQRRDLSIEFIESRIALSVNPGLVDEFGNGDDMRFLLAASHVSEQAILAADNSTDTARDLGVLDGQYSLQNEYVGTFDPRDVYRFELESATSVSVNLHSMANDADLYLLNANREIIAQSELSGSSAESLQLNLDVGEYFVIVNNYNVWTSTTYSLDIVAAQADLAGDSLETAYDLGELSSQFALQGQVGGSDTADAFQFQLAASAYVTFELSSLQADLDLYIYDSNGELLGGSNAPDTTDEFAEGQLSAGTYYAMIVPYLTADSSYNFVIKNTTATEPPGGEPDDGSNPGSGSDPGSGSGENNDPEADPDDNGSSDPPGQITIDQVPYFGSSRDWGINSVDAPEAWNAGYTGEGVTVAVIDTGFQLDHSDLQNVYWSNADEVPGDGIDNDGNGYVDDSLGWDFVQNDANPTSTSSNHGTHVAGIIAANRNSSGGTGVAYASQIMPIRVLDDDGSGSTFDVAQGIRYAVNNGADIINLSLGGSDSPVIRSALEYAASNDVFVVAAAGNEGASSTSYPARHSSTLTNVLSVGAHSSSNQLASFSNLVGTSNSVQVDGPGVSIYSTVIGNSYSYLSGTSMASPYVAGVAALTLSANPDLTASELRQVLVQGATLQIGNSDSVGAVSAANSIELGSTLNTSSPTDSSSGSSDNAPGTLGATSVSVATVNSRLVQLQLNLVADRTEFGFDLDQDDEAVDSGTLELIAQDHNANSTPDAFANEEFGLVDDVLA